MFKGAETEWSPKFGESWQVPQVPEKDAGSPGTSLIPATPEIVIGLDVKRACPRAMLARALFPEFTQASNKLKTAGLNGAPVGLNAKLAGNESLMPMKKACAARDSEPPLAPSRFKGPARKSRDCAVRREVSKFTIS